MLRQERDAQRAAPASEGALDNDVFVPLAEGAAEALASGDQALARARADGPPAEAERQLDLAFDQWHGALVAGGPGASSGLGSAAGANEARSGEQRLSEGVHAGVLRRLLALDRTERERWTTRHTPLAALALEGLHDDTPPARRTARLGEIVRLFPLTPAGARAALELGDLALEAGLAQRAFGWYTKSEREAELCAERELLAALRVRFSALARPAAATAEAWQRATRAELADTLVWSEPGRRARYGALSEGERGLRPGGAFLDAGHIAVQTPAELLLVGLAVTGELELDARLRTADFLAGYAPGEFEAPLEPPGWPLLPVADEHGVVMVVGRTLAGEPNALLALALELPDPARELGLRLGSARASARLAWAIVGSERLGARGVESVPELEDLGDYELQPGPVACGEQIVVQARQFDAQVQSFLLAFDRHDGALLWKRQLAAGADRVATQRFAQSSKRVAGQPLLAFEVEHEARVFAGTHLGLGVLLDGLSGEPLWSFKNRRRGEREPGWSGDRPLLGSGPGEAPVVLWAPMDSDRLYTLVPRPLADASGASRAVLSAPPAALSEAQALLGGDAREHLVLGRSGRERTVSARRAGLDRIDALDLAQDERFAGAGLASTARAWVATNRGLYLLDRSRDLYRLDFDAWPEVVGVPLGGDVLARGAHVLVLGASALWSFRVR